MNIKQLWTASNFSLPITETLPSGTFAEACYDQNSINDLRDKHEPEDADITDMQEWNLTPLAWAAQIELAYRYKQAELNEHNPPSKVRHKTKQTAQRAAKLMKETGYKKVSITKRKKTRRKKTTRKTTMNRSEIAAELLKDCPAESKLDHEYLAELIQDQVPWETILERPEANRWPETYRWLKDNRPSNEKKIVRKRKTPVKRKKTVKRKKRAATKVVTFRKKRFTLTRGTIGFPASVKNRTLKTESLYRGTSGGKVYAVWLSKKTGKVTGTAYVSTAKKKTAKKRRKKTTRKRKK